MKMSYNIVTFLSDYKNSPNITTQQYESDFINGFKEQGYHTNDAPLKNLLHYIFEKGEKIDKVFFIVTGKVINNKISISDKDFVCNLINKKEFDNVIERTKFVIRDFCNKKNIQEPTFQRIKYHLESVISSVKSMYKHDEIANNIVEEIKKNIGTGSDDRVLIDYTGGTRDVSLLMVSLIRFLESIDIKCEKVVYSNNNIYPPTVSDITNIYGMFDVVSGVDEFITSGKVTTLSRVFENSRANGSMSNIILNMKNFASAIAICDLSDIDSMINNLDVAINKEIDQLKGETLAEMTFKHLKDRIIEKMHLKNIKKDSGEINYIEVIRWCVENELLQQAITLYVEKLPELYMKSGKLKQIYLDLIEKNLENKKEPDSTKFYSYYDFFLEKETDDLKEMLLKCSKECKNKGIGEFRQYIRKIREKILGRLQNVIMQAYSNEGQKKTEFEIKYGDNDLIISLPSKFNTADCFCKEILNKDIVCYYLAKKKYKDYEEYRKSKKEYKQKGQEATPWKKMRAIKNMDPGCIEEGIMSYYLALKVYRNNMNHASVEMNDYDKRCIDELAKQKILDLKMEKNELVRKLIEDGLDASEKFLQ